MQEARRLASVAPFAISPIDSRADAGPTRWIDSPRTRRNTMSSIVKVVELIAQSEKSFDDAVVEALKEASQTIDDIKEIWVSGQKALVENNRIVGYRVTTKISFLVKGHG
jgi:dodecin